MTTSDETKVAVARYKAYKAALEVTPDEDADTRRALKKAIYKAFDAVIEQQDWTGDDVETEQTVPGGA